MEEKEIKETKKVKKSNDIALIGFICSFFVKIAGLILCIIGLSKSKELKDGRGISIAGIIISSVGIIINIIITIFLILLLFNESTEPLNSTQYYCKYSYDCERNTNGNYTCEYYESGKRKYIECDEKYLKADQIAGNEVYDNIF